MNDNEIAKILIDNGAHWNVENNNGETSYALAVKLHNTDILAEIRKKL